MRPYRTHASIFWPEELVQLLRDLVRKQHHRAIAIGALGVPPDYLGDLSRGDSNCWRWRFRPLETQIQDFLREHLPIGQWHFRTEHSEASPHGLNPASHQLFDCDLSSPRLAHAVAFIKSGLDQRKTSV